MKRARKRGHPRRMWRWPMLNLHTNARALYGTSFGVFLLLSLLVAVGPAYWAQENNQPLPGTEPLTEQEQLGQHIYISEGCVACHTQQVRPVPSDEVFGRPAVPADFARYKPKNAFVQAPRSEERRVGKECRSRWARSHSKQHDSRTPLRR